MPRQWESKEVDSHGAGITDDIKNAPPIFQAEGNNIVFDFKTHNLSNRRGSQILRDGNGDFDQDLIDALLGFRIEQIFQLENKLLISAWSDVTDSGKIITYDEKTLAVELVTPPSSRKGLDAYSTVPAETNFFVRFETSDSKGLEGDLISAGLDAENTNHIDHIIFNIFSSDTDLVKVTNYKDRINVCFVAIEYTSLGATGAIGTTWGTLLAAINNEGHNLSLVTGTASEEALVLDGDLTVSSDFTKAQWGEENPSDIDADYRSSVTTLGHLQSPIYTGEAFIATEPYDKSFAVNPLDANMIDPENFKPITKRATIKRISQYWDGSVATPQIRDAQLPETYLGQEEFPRLNAASNPSVPAEYKYIKHELTLATEADKASTGAIDIWLDRVIGHTDNGTGNMPIVFRNTSNSTLPTSNSTKQYYIKFTGGNTAGYDGNNYIVFGGSASDDYALSNLWYKDGITTEKVGYDLGLQLSAITDVGVGIVTSFETTSDSDDVYALTSLSNLPIAQVFQPNIEGTSSEIEFKLRKVGAPTGYLTFSLYEFDRDRPNPDGGTKVFEGNLDLIDISASMDWVTYPTGLDFEAYTPIGLPGDWYVMDKLDSTHNYLNISVLTDLRVESGQLAIITSSPGVPYTGQEIYDKIGQAFVDYFTRDRSSSASWFALYPNLGWSMTAGAGFSSDTTYDLWEYYVDLYSFSEYHSLLPINLSNYVYNYAFYLRESYIKTDDAVPKFVENNGPTAFLQVGTLSEISSVPNQVGYWPNDDQGVNPPDYTTEISLSPILVGSISQRFTRVETDLFDFNDVVGVFARTQNTGTVYYDIGETNWFIPNELAVEDANATFDPESWEGEDYGYFCRITDENFDRDIIANELSYFNGGVLSYASLPQGSKYMTMVNGTAYYGSIIDNEARVFQSAPGIPSSAPRLLFSEFEDPITALNSFLEKPIVFTENKTWRIEGVKDATGVGRVFLRVVSDEFGCIANQSVVKTNIGLFYWSKVGIIYTDGLRASRVSEHLLARFQLWKQALMPNGLEIGPIGLRGAYDEVSKQIIYSGVDPASLVIANEALPGQDVEGVPNWILLDVYYGVSKSMPFYTANGPALLQEDGTFKKDTFQTRVVWFSEDTLNVYRGQIGYDGDTVIGSAILTHEELLTNDEIYETIDYPIYSPIDPFYKSVAMSHGQKGARKWTSKVMINFVDLNSTGVSIQPLGWNDLNPRPHMLAPCINYQHFKQVDFSPELNPDFPPTIIQYFKNTDTSIYGDHLISYRRRFPRGRIRNVYKQFGFKQLVQEYATYQPPDVTITKIANQPFSPVKVRLATSGIGDKTFILGNGVSYAKFSWSDEWFKIVEVTNDNVNGGDTSYLEFICLTSRDTLSTSGIVITDESVVIGRSPLDQAIQLSDWTMTFTRLGDRTQGSPKAKELGGHT